MVEDFNHVGITSIVNDDTFEKLHGQVNDKKIYEELMQERKRIKSLKRFRLFAGIGIILLVVMLFYSYNYFSNLTLNKDEMYKKAYAQAQEDIVFDIQYKKEIPYLLPEGNDLKINYMSKEMFCSQ